MKHSPSQKPFRKHKQTHFDQIKPSKSDESVSTILDLEKESPEKNQQCNQAYQYKPTVLVQNFSEDSKIIMEKESENEQSDQDQVSFSEKNQTLNGHGIQLSQLKLDRIDTDMNYTAQQLIKPDQKYSLQKLVQKTDSQIKSNKIQNDFPQNKNQVESEKTIYDGYNLLQKLILYHIYSFIRKMRTLKLTHNETIQINQLPLLAEKDSVEYNLKQFYLINSKSKKTKLISSIKLFYLFFIKYNICLTLLIVTLAMIETYSRFAMAIIIERLISSVQQKNMAEAQSNVILWAILVLISLISKHYQQYVISNFGSRMRMILINLIYDQIMKLNINQLQHLDVGKILNAANSDLNLIEYQLGFIYQVAIIPGSLLFSGIILWQRFDGPIGLIAVVFCAILYPVQICIQHINKRLILNARKFQDQRIQQTNTMIEGMKYIKMYVWEQFFISKINNIRMKEIMFYFKIQILNLIDRSLNFSVQIWGSYFFILILSAYGSKLSISSIMSTIQLMSMIKFYCVFQVSQAFQALMNFSVIFQRVSEIIMIQNNKQDSDQTLTNTLIKNTNTAQTFDSALEQRGLNHKHSLFLQSKILVKLSQFSCKWQKNTLQILHGINLDIQSGEIMAVIGKVGSGKSTLLSALLNNVPYCEGNIIYTKKLKTAYVEQDPFIYTGSIQENITFGSKFDQTLYMKVLEVSCLDQDILSFKKGDKTEIGEKGANLSGGQKARLSLARALYSLSDLYIFDDPLSAVDSKVAGKIFNNAITEFIFNFQPRYKPTLQKSQTIFIMQVPAVVLATHQVQFALECDYTIILEGGTIKHQGTKKQMGNHILELMNGEHNQQTPTPDNQKTKSIFIRKQSKIGAQVMTKLKENKEDSNQLYASEEAQQKDCSHQTYLRFLKCWKPTFLVIFIIIQNIGSEIINNYYYNYMGSYSENDQDANTKMFYAAGFLVLIGYLNNFIKYFLNIFGIITANNFIHQNMIAQLIKSPISFFDINPSGRLINRFSTDLSLADNQIQSTIADIFEQGAQFLVSIVVISIFSPFFSIAALITILSTIVIFRTIRPIVSKLKVCDLIQRSPLFDYLKLTIYGTTQIRISQNQKWMRDKFLLLSNNSLQANLMFLYSQKCFAFYIDLFGTIASIAGTFLVTVMIDNPTTFSQTLLLLSTFNTQASTLRQFMALDSIMNSVNRMFEICDLEGEKEVNNKKFKIELEDWPSNGTIKFENVQMKYRENTPYVLKGMNFLIKDKQKVGIVGRTGSGKSSVIQCLFRMNNIEDNGLILIGNQDIKNISLYKLRDEINIIPQFPFIFKGTLRENIDPIQKSDDKKIIQILQETGLESLLNGLPNGLNSLIEPELFSIGQKQLICLSRVLLNKKKILILDEATANIDIHTDSIIQSIIKEKFSDCTILTIAHRLNTIADYDKVIVLENGMVLEQGHPFELLVDDTTDDNQISSRTLFAQMVLQTGQKTSSRIFETTRRSYIQINELEHRNDVSNEISISSENNSIREYHFKS